MDVLTAASTFVFGNKFPKTPEPLVSVSLVSSPSVYGAQRENSFGIF